MPYVIVWGMQGSVSRILQVLRKGSKVRFVSRDISTCQCPGCRGDEVVGCGVAGECYVGRCTFLPTSAPAIFAVRLASGSVPVRACVCACVARRRHPQ